MTPQEKANELIDKFYMADENLSISNPSQAGWICNELAKRCALIAVEEILKEMNKLMKYWQDDIISPETYWYNVKEEIKKL